MFTNYKSELFSFHYSFSIPHNLLKGILGNPFPFIQIFWTLAVQFKNKMNMEIKNNSTDLEGLLKKVLEKLESREETSRPKYYRNKDLRKVFGLSSNTIIKYRDNGILPYTILGDIYLYPATEIEKILNKHSTIK